MHIRARALKAATFVIYESQDGVDWRPLLPTEVPAWVKEPSVLGAMKEGLCARYCKAGEGETGPYYRADASSESAIAMPRPHIILPN